MMAAKKKATKRASALESIAGLSTPPAPGADQGERAESASTGSKKARAWFHIPEDLDEAFRDAVVALSGPPEHLNLSKFGERAIRTELERLQEEYNDGKPFPPRGAEVRQGRPPK